MTTTQRKFHVVIVGAGFAGLYMLYRCRKLELSVHLLEAGGGVGGTWYWNRYPGARCDVESMQYSYQFSERPAAGVEVDRALRQSTRDTPLPRARDGSLRALRSSIQFDTRVTAAAFDETSARWTVLTGQSDGQSDGFSSQFLIMATGCLSATNMPEIGGAETFSGSTFHTGRWPHAGVDFTDRRVWVIGTGSSGVQSYTVYRTASTRSRGFQRTATYFVPARNGPIDRTEEREIKANYAESRAADRQVFSAIGDRRPWTDRRCPLGLGRRPADRVRSTMERWGLSFLGAFSDLLVDPAANETAAGFVRQQIRALVKDSRTVERLCPDQVIGCKRMCVDTNYYSTFNLPHVHLVDLRESPIEAITPTGVLTRDGHYELDDIVYATGFDAMTGRCSAIDIRAAAASPCSVRGPMGRIRISGSAWRAFQTCSPSPGPVVLLF